MYQLFASVSSVPSATNVCGTVGIHNDTKISYYMGNFFYKGPSTFTLCASYCRKDAPKCKSFRYSYWEDSAAQYCEFFDNGLEGNVTADSSQPYYYYDIGCPIPAYIDVSTSNETPMAATRCTQMLYRSQIGTTTYTLSAGTQTVTKTPDTQTRTIYSTITTTLSSTTTQAATRTERLNQTTTTTLTQSVRATITETRPPTITRLSRISTLTQVQIVTVLRISTLVRFRSITVSSTRSVTSIQTSTVTKSVVGAAIGARTVTITSVVTTTRRG